MRRIIFSLLILLGLGREGLMLELLDSWPLLMAVWCMKERFALLGGDIMINSVIIKNSKKLCHNIIFRNMNPRTKTKIHKRKKTVLQFIQNTMKTYAVIQIQKESTHAMHRNIA